VSAEELPAAAMKAFPAGHPGRGYSHLSAMSAMMKAGRMELAERYGLEAYRLMVESFDDLNWATERSVGMLRILYGQWPRHAAELERWQLAAARVRFMVASAGEQATTMKLLTELAAERVKAGRTGDDATAAGVLAVVWSRGQELAPPGHERRAAFFANVALASGALGRTELRDQSLAVATEAIAYARDVAVAEAVIAAAKAAGN